jgi:hypothetical protein
MLGEEALRTQSIVLFDRAQHVIATYAVPSHHRFTLQDVRRLRFHPRQSLGRNKAGQVRRYLDGSFGVQRIPGVETVRRGLNVVHVERDVIAADVAILGLHDLLIRRLIAEELDVRAHALAQCSKIAQTLASASVRPIATP